MARPTSSADARHNARSLRSNLTPAEARLWSALRRSRLGVRFRRQVPIGQWIADFACLQPRLVVEVDDLSHVYRDESHRTSYLERQGFTVLRYSNAEIAFDLEGVVAGLRRVIDELTADTRR